MSTKRYLRYLSGAMRAWLIACLVGGVVLAANVSPGTANASPSSVSSDSLVIGIDGDPATLDPALTTGSNELLIATQIFDTLTAYQPGSSILEPALAQSWQISSDGLTWTFNLRPGLVFQDGSTLDADAVLFNLLRWWDPLNPNYEPGNYLFEALFGGFKGNDACLIHDIRAGESTQVIFEMTKPNIPVPNMLAMIAFGIASPANIAAGNVATQPVGSGPYQFVQWAADDSVTLQANPHYWGAQPRIGNLIFKVLVDTMARYNALVLGEIHSAYNLPKYLLPGSDDNSILIGWRGVNTWYLGMNRGHPDFDNLLVRQAIAHAIDRQALINNLTPDDLLAKQYLPPSIWGYDPDLQDYSYDPALSKQLLEQAGFTGTLYTTLSYLNVIRPYIPDQALIANQIAADLEEVGIHAELIGYESSTFLEKYNNGDFDLFLMGWIADYLHPDNFFSPVLCNPGVLGFGPLDIELCKNVQSALAKHDPDQQIIAFQAISQQVHYSLPLLPLAHTQAPLFYRAELGGLTPSPLGLEIYKDVYFVHPCFLPLVNR